MLRQDTRPSPTAVDGHLDDLLPSRERRALALKVHLEPDIAAERRARREQLLPDVTDQWRVRAG
jgi:hypothetical protein